jgi:predicted ATPase/DNA-binding SARP family transcriptional activator
MAIPAAAMKLQSALVTLGKFELWVENRLAPAPPTHKARALVAFLVTDRGHDVARERLLELFWSEFQPERAREGLRTALSSIRHALRSASHAADGALFADKSVVRWVGVTELDVSRFEEFAQSADVAYKRAALRLYGGDFLEGNCEEWAVGERERISAVYEAVLADLVEQSEDVEAARLLLARNPFQEQAYATLIHAELQANRPVAAAQLVTQYRAAMEEIDGDASPEFRKRFAHIQELDALQRAARKMERAKTVRAEPSVGRTNLPSQLTSFIGRGKDLDDLKSLVQRSRLVTLVGPGGIGKTRLAMESGAALRERFEDGVWFVDLATISDPHYVGSTIASALHVSSGTPERSLQDALIAALQKYHALLIFDNCEHIVAAVVRMAELILRSCPNVSILATSRERLSAEGEDVVGILPLAEDEAIGLFAERARAVDKNFVLSERNSSAVASICRTLDGIPLAIELAAPRVGVLSLKRLNMELDRHFGILSSASSTTVPRHKTVRALVDWSYELLAPDEKELFRYTGVFAGGFTLEAAEAIFNGKGADSAIVDLVSSLTTKSLLLADTGPERERYRMLQTTQQYAVEKLRENRELGEVRERHARYFLRLMEQADDTYGAANAPEWLQRYRFEIGNVRSAIDFCFESGDAFSAAALIAAARELWQELGLYAEGMHRAQHALHALGEDAPLALRAGLWLLVVQHANTLRLVPQKGLEMARRARDAFEALHDEPHLAYAWQSIGNILVRSGAHDEAEVALERAQALAERQGNRRVLMRVLLRRAQNILEGSSPQQALPLYQRDLELARVLQAEQYEGDILDHMGEAFFALGDVGEEVANATAAHEIFARCKDAAKEANALDNLAAYHIALGDLEVAGDYARRGLRRARQAESHVNVTIAVQHLAALAALEQQSELAARLLGFTAAAFVRPAYTENFTRDKALQALTGRFEDAQLQALLKDGAALSEEEACTLALSWH